MNARWALLLTLTALWAGCKEKRRPTAFVELERPACEADVVVDRTLRSGEQMRSQDVVEHFTLARGRDCAYVRVEQEWALSTADIEVLYDEAYLPIRVWRRTTLPDITGPLGHEDLRVYDLRGEQVRMTHRGPAGRESIELVAEERPRAVITHGRGSLTAWIQRARLDEGERLRETVLDVRDSLAKVDEVTLIRQNDQEADGLGRVRVYTIYGREPVFADENNIVLGDMLGLREASTIEGPIPDPMPDRASFEPATYPQ